MSELINAVNMNNIDEVEILLENGMVLEEGTHSELLKKGGKYSEMYITQISD